MFRRTDSPKAPSEFGSPGKSGMGFMSAARDVPGRTWDHFWPRRPGISPAVLKATMMARIRARITSWTVLALTIALASACSGPTAQGYGDPFDGTAGGNAPVLAPMVTE